MLNRKAKFTLVGICNAVRIK